MTFTTDLFPDVVHGTLVAVLLVDLERGEVTYANDLARQLAPSVDLPIGVDDWSRAAGLEDFAGDDLAGPATDSHPLSRVAAGEPVYGEAVTAGRASDATSVREPLWVLGLPMRGGPGVIEGLALVAFLPMRNSTAVAGAQETAGALRERALLATPVSFTISDPSTPDNVLVWVNPAFTETTGYTAEDAVGYNCRFLQGPETDRRIVDQIKASVAAGQPITTTLLNYRKDGTSFWNQLSISPVRDSTGTVTHHVGVQTDVSDQVDVERGRAAALLAAERAGARLSLVASLTSELGSAITPDEVVRRVSRFAVTRMATWSAFYTLDDHGRIGSPVIEHRRAGTPAIDRAITRLGEIMPSALPNNSPIRQILERRAHHLLISSVGTDGRLMGEDERTSLDLVLGLASIMIVPLVARGSIIGALALVRDDTLPAFADDDLSLLIDLGGRTAMAYDNAQLFTRQRDASETLQRSLLPALPDIDALEICAAYLPATARAAVGGDWYDVFEQDDGRIGVAVGDVMGHDLNAAASMGQLRSALLAYAWAGAEPPVVLDRLDHLVGGLGLGQLATCGYGALTRQPDGSATLDWSSAGHPPPVVLPPQGPCFLLVESQERMIGLTRMIGIPPGTRTSTRTELAAGTKLICYTDGLLDAFDTDMDMGLAALRGLVDAQPAGVTCSQLVKVLTSAAHRDGRNDDIAVLVVALLPT